MDWMEKTFQKQTHASLGNSLFALLVQKGWQYHMVLMKMVACVNCQKDYIVPKESGRL